MKNEDLALRIYKLGISQSGAVMFCPNSYAGYIKELKDKQPVNVDRVIKSIWSACLKSKTLVLIKLEHLSAVLWDCVEKLNSNIEFSVLYLGFNPLS